MKFTVILAIASMSLGISSGCVTITPQQQAAINDSVPVCFGERDCETKWAAAGKWVLDNVSSKIQIYSDDLIETYEPVQNSSSLAARIVKDQAGPGSYSIVAEAWCDNIFGCVPQKADALISFNNYVNSATVKDDSVYKNALKKHKYSKPLMGVSLYSANGKTIVKNVHSGSPAEKAGMKAQDILTQFAGKTIHAQQDLQDFLGEVRFGGEVDVIVKRGGRLVPLKVKFPSESELQKMRKSNGTINAVANSNKRP